MAAPLKVVVVVLLMAVMEVLLLVVDPVSAADVKTAWMGVVIFRV